jgi:hypothetical protein
MAGRGGILRGLTITKTEKEKAKSKKFFMMNFRFLCQCGRGFSSLGGRNTHLGMSSNSACSSNPRPTKKPRRPAQNRPQNPSLQQAPVSDSDSGESPAVSGDVGYDVNVDDGHETEDPSNTPLGWKISLFIIIYHNFSFSQRFLSDYRPDCGSTGNVDVIEARFLKLITELRLSNNQADAISR